MNAPERTTQVLPYASHEARRFGLVSRIILVALWVYPLLPIAALYATWIVAWIVLGHKPRPGLDDPKYISPIVDVPYGIAAILVGTSPVTAIIALPAGFMVTTAWVWSKQISFWGKLMLIGMFVLLYPAAFFLLVWDPLRVLYWFMD